MRHSWYVTSGAYSEEEKNTRFRVQPWVEPRIFSVFLLLLSQLLRDVVACVV